MATVAKKPNRKAQLERRASALKRLSDQAHALRGALLLATAGDPAEGLERLAARIDSVRADLLGLAVEAQHDARGGPETYPLFDAPPPSRPVPSPSPAELEMVEARPLAGPFPIGTPAGVVMLPAEEEAPELPAVEPTATPEAEAVEDLEDAPAPKKGRKPKAERPDRRVKAPAPFVPPVELPELVAYRKSDGLALAITRTDAMDGRIPFVRGMPQAHADEWIELVGIRAATDGDRAEHLPSPGECAWERFLGGAATYPDGADPNLPPPSAEAPAGVKRPEPAPAPAPSGDKLAKRQCWVAMLEGAPAFRVYRRSEAEATAELAERGIYLDSPAYAMALEFTNRSHEFNACPILSDLSADQARDRVRQLLAAAEASSGSGFVEALEGAPAGEEAPALAEVAVVASEASEPHAPLFYVRVPQMGAYVAALAAIREAGVKHVSPHQLAVDDLDFVLGQGLPTLAEWAGEPAEAPEEEEAPGPDLGYPTSVPPDPMTGVPVAVLGLRGELVAKLLEAGIDDVATLAEAVGSNLVERAGISHREDTRVFDAIRKRQNRRRDEVLASGEWLDEELTYHALHKPTAVAVWDRLRAGGATDGEVRDAINKSFYQGGSGFNVGYRVGSWFERSDKAPAFFRGAARPPKQREPVLEGAELVARVRRLLAIPTKALLAVGGKGGAK